jgi:hypothetical protein
MMRFNAVAVVRCGPPHRGTVQDALQELDYGTDR